MAKKKASWKVSRKQTIQRLRLVGPIEDSKEALEYLWSLGYRCTQTGPYYSKAMWPSVDVTRFMYYAEREVDENTARVE